MCPTIIFNGAEAPIISYEIRNHTKIKMAKINLKKNNVMIKINTNWEGYC